MGKCQSCDPCLLGTLYVNWDTRAFVVEGINGIGCKALTPQDVVAFFELPTMLLHEERYALVYWLEQEQLCIHDIAGFSSEVWDPLSNEEDDNND